MIWKFFKNLFATKQPGEAEQGPSPQTGDATFQPVTPLPSPEELCGIDAEKMDKEEIRSLLKKLYKRHNEAAASLNEKLRTEAETMLDAIVECRSKYIDNA